MTEEKEIRIGGAPPLENAQILIKNVCKKLDKEPETLNKEFWDLYQEKVGMGKTGEPAINAAYISLYRKYRREMQTKAVAVQCIVYGIGNRYLTKKARSRIQELGIEMGAVGQDQYDIVNNGSTWSRVLQAFIKDPATGEWMKDGQLIFMNNEQSKLETVGLDEESMFKLCSANLVHNTDTNNFSSSVKTKFSVDEKQDTDFWSMIETVEIGKLPEWFASQEAQELVDEKYGNTKEIGFFKGIVDSYDPTPVSSGNKLMRLISLMPFDTDDPPVTVWVPEWARLSCGDESTIIVSGRAKKGEYKEQEQYSIDCVGLYVVESSGKEPAAVKPKEIKEVDSSEEDEFEGV